MPERRIPFAHGISFVRKGPAEILQDLFPDEEDCGCFMISLFSIR